MTDTKKQNAAVNTPAPPSIRVYVITGVVLLLLWTAAAGLIAKIYQSWKSDQLYLETQKSAEIITNDLQKRMMDAFSLLRAMPIILSQSTDIKESLENHRGHGKYMINRPEKEILDHINEHPELRATSRMLKKITDDIGTVNVFWITEEHGVCLASSNAETRQSFIGKNFSHHSYFHDTVDGRSVIRYSMGYFFDIPGLYFSSPVFNNDKVIGAVTAKVSLNYLYQWLSKTNAFIVDRYGVIIYAYDPAYQYMLMPKATVYTLSAEDRQLRYGQTEFKEIGFRKQEKSSNDALYLINGGKTPYYALSARIPDLEFKLITIIKTPSEEEIAWQTTIYFFLLLLAGIFVIIGGSCLNYYIQYRYEQNRIHIQKLISRDALTGFYNRSVLHPLIDQKISQARQRSGFFAILFLDIDLFKDINDSFGHEIGDEVLQQLSGRIKSVIKESDIIIRHAGDDFIVLLDTVQNQEDVAELARSLMVHSQQPFYLQHNIVLTLSISIGIVIFPGHGETASLLLRHADTALYYVKQNGRNNYAFYQSQMSTELLMRKSLENDMVHALENNEFFLVYQPQYCYAKKGIASCEALIRWRHPVHGIIPPATFIPIAENSGFIKQLGNWILDEACRQAVEWHKNLGMTLSVAVNLSANQFQDDLPEIIKAVVARHDMHPQMLELELTESILMKNVTQSLEIIQKIKSMGSRISLDDFGTGYSSLAYLQKFPIDTLKIDRSFVSDMENSASSRAIINAIISMAQGLDYQVIAEGIETPEQYDLLMKMGCHIIQGYWFSRPLTADQFADFYAKNRCETTEEQP